MSCPLFAFFKGIELSSEIWFGSQNGRIWRIDKKSGKASLLQLQVQSDIVDFIRTSDHEVCIFTRNAGFAVFNTTTNSIKIYNTGNLKGLTSNEIRPLHIDKMQNLWFETNHIGINRFNFKTGNFKSYNVSSIDMMTFVSPPIALVIEDVKGRKELVYP